MHALPKELEKHKNIKQKGSSSHDKPTKGTTYLITLIIIPKGDYINCVLDASHFNSKTNQSDEIRLIEPPACQLARAYEKHKRAIDLMYAYAYTPLTTKQNHSLVFRPMKNYLRSFYGLKGLPTVFTRQISLFFKTLFDQGFALVYIDHILLLSNSKDHMFQPIEQLQLINTKNNPTLATENPFPYVTKGQTS